MSSVRPPAPKQSTVDDPGRGSHADHDTAADKVLRLLCAFGDVGDAHLSDLARVAELPKSTAHRLLATLQRHALVERSEHGTYRLGLGVWKLGRSARPYEGLARAAKPHLEALVEASGESSFLTIAEDDHALCVATAASPSLMRLTLEPGSLAPIHLGASNRILLAFLPAGARDRIVRRWSSDEADRIALEEDLQRIRRNGFVVTSSQLTTAATAVAVPVFDEKGALIAGLSLGGPTDRLGPAAAEACVETLRDRADAIAHDLAQAQLFTATP